MILKPEEKYYLCKEIGKGAFGSVFSAIDLTKEEMQG